MSHVQHKSAQIVIIHFNLLFYFAIDACKVYYNVKRAFRSGEATRSRFFVIAWSLGFNSLALAIREMIWLHFVVEFLHSHEIAQN